MASIFKTLEGGHLDRALFPSQVKEGEEGDNAKADKTIFPGRLRFTRRRKDRADSGENRPRTPRSDAGL